MDGCIHSDYKELSNVNCFLPSIVSAPDSPTSFIVPSVPLSVSFFEDDFSLVSPLTSVMASFDWLDITDSAADWTVLSALEDSGLLAGGAVEELVLSAV